MAKYLTPVIEIEKMEVEDVIATSSPSSSIPEGDGDDLPFQPANNSAKGIIAGGSTVSNIAGSGASNAFSAGDIFGLR